MGYVLFGQFGRVHTAPSVLDVATLLIGYTGEYTDQANVVMSGKAYRLLTLTGSGTLTLAKPAKADVWLCNGGNSGQGIGSGGGGGYIYQVNGQTLSKTTACVIGAGGKGGSDATTGWEGGSTTFGDFAATAQQSGKDYIACGASGGGYGGGYNAREGVGSGVTTVPFAETSIFDKHSAGGGGGGLRDREEAVYYIGGDGGSDGANGGNRVKGTSSKYTGGAGGEKGAGAGGTGASSSSSNAGGDATFYGSGGGGGGSYFSTSGTASRGNGGAGYQGVIYVRIPYEQ